MWKYEEITIEIPDTLPFLSFQINDNESISNTVSELMRIDSYMYELKQERIVYFHHKTKAAPILDYIKKSYTGWLRKSDSNAYSPSIHYEFYLNEKGEILAIHYNHRADNSNIFEKTYYFENDKIAVIHEHVSKETGTSGGFVNSVVHTEGYDKHFYFINNELAHFSEYMFGNENCLLHEEEPKLPSKWKTKRIGNDQSENAYFLLSVGKFLLQHDSIDCQTKKASFPNGYQYFVKFFDKNFDRALHYNLEQHKFNFYNTLEFSIDSFGRTSNFTFRDTSKYHDPEMLQLDSLTRKEIIRIVGAKEWNSATKRCIPRNSSKRINIWFNKKINRSQWDPKRRTNFTFNADQFTGER